MNGLVGDMGLGTLGIPLNLALLTTIVSETEKMLLAGNRIYQYSVGV